MTYHNRVWISECAYHFDGSHSSRLAIAKIHRTHSNIPFHKYWYSWEYIYNISYIAPFIHFEWLEVRTIEAIVNRFDRNAIFDLVRVFLLHQK